MRSTLVSARAICRHELWLSCQLTRRRDSERQRHKKGGQKKPEKNQTKQHPNATAKRKTYRGLRELCPASARKEKEAVTSSSSRRDNRRKGKTRENCAKQNTATAAIAPPSYAPRAAHAQRTHAIAPHTAKRTPPSAQSHTKNSEQPLPQQRNTTPPRRRTVNAPFCQRSEKTCEERRSNAKISSQQNNGCRKAQKRLNAEKRRRKARKRLSMRFYRSKASTRWCVMISAVRVLSDARQAKWPDF